MGLKKVETLRYELRIDELDKTISYRGFKHGEQKILLTALELKDPGALVNAILDIVSACTFGTLEVSKVPMYIIDLVFMKIYTASVGDKSPALFTCANMVPDSKDLTHEVKCGFQANISIDLGAAEIEYPEGFKASATIDIDSENSIKLRVPDFKAFKEVSFEGSVIDVADQLIYAGIEAICQGDDVLTPSIDFTREELQSWLDDLDSTAMEKISAFFDDFPQLVLRQKVTCPKCGGKEEFRLTGLDAFFG